MHVEVTCPAGTNMHICITCFTMQLAVGSKLILIPATLISICGLGPHKIHYCDFFGILPLGELLVSLSDGEESRMASRPLVWLRK